MAVYNNYFRRLFIILQTAISIHGCLQLLFLKAVYNTLNSKINPWLFTITIFEGCLYYFKQQNQSMTVYNNYFRRLFIILQTAISIHGCLQLLFWKAVFNTLNSKINPWLFTITIFEGCL